MIRHATLFWVTVGALFLGGLTIVGHEVRDRDQTLRELHGAIEREREKIHVLRAEKAYLSSSEVIAQRASSELGMIEFKATQIIRIADLPKHIPEPGLDFTLPDYSTPLLSLLAPEREFDTPSSSFATALTPDWPTNVKFSRYSSRITNITRPQS
jgi:hypothetical protein